MINFSKIKDKHREAANGGPPTKKQRQSPDELVLHKGWYISQAIAFPHMIKILKSSGGKCHSMSVILFIIF